MAKHSTVHLFGGQVGCCWVSVRLPVLTDFSVARLFFRSKNWKTSRLSPVFSGFRHLEIFSCGGEIWLQPERFLEMRDRFLDTVGAG